MIAILNEAGEVVAQGHKTPKEARAWVRWALTVRPGAKYKVLVDTKEDIEKAEEPSEEEPT